MNLVDNIQSWEDAIGARVRAAMASPELTRYFAVKMTPARARIALLQLSLFVNCRRDCWGQFDRQLRCRADAPTFDGA